MAPLTKPDGRNTKPDSRERVRQACQRCRWKKLRCDGIVPCQRCIQAGMCCQQRERKKLSTEQTHAEYVANLEEQQALLAAALKLTWSHLFADECREVPTVHDMIARLRLLPKGQQTGTRPNTLTSLPEPGPDDVDDLLHANLNAITNQLQYAHTHFCCGDASADPTTVSDPGDCRESSEHALSGPATPLTPDMMMADDGTMASFALLQSLQPSMGDAQDPAYYTWPGPREQASYGSMDSALSTGDMLMNVEPWKLSHSQGFPM